MQDKTSANIIGPDLNEYRGEVDYSLLATRTNFCYLRASGNGSGRFRADRKFIEYAQGLKSVNILTGGYHYAVPSYDLTTADTQCDEFIDILQQAYGEGKYGDLYPVIDIEAPADKSISTDALLDWVDRFRKRFERKTRRKMMLYTGSFFIELYNNFYHSTKGFILSDMPLWIAMYTDIPSNPPYPKDQGGWTRWRMWQFTENGTIDGVSPPVDLNYGPTNVDLLTQPDVVSNFTAVGSGQNIRLNWSPNKDADLAGYNIFINSNYVTTVGRDATSYTIELGRTPAPGQSFEVSIEAFDIDGDFSPERARVAVTFDRYNDEDSGAYNEDCRAVKDIYSDEEDDFIDYAELEPDYIPSTYRYKDPVDNLERKFMFNNENFEEMQRGVNHRFRENLIPTDDLYDDFFHKNNEFDDKGYLLRLEEENAYKKFYGAEASEDEYEYIKVKKQCKCKCGDKDHDDHDDDHNKAQEGCKIHGEKEDLRCSGEDADKGKCNTCTCKAANSEEKDKLDIHESIDEGKVQEADDKDEIKFVYNDNYEGTRRRCENHEHKKHEDHECKKHDDHECKKYDDHECKKYDDNECKKYENHCNKMKCPENLQIEVEKLGDGQGGFSIYDLYLNKCDYGYQKTNKSKKIKHMECDKPKKKKHHKHH